MNNLFDQEKKRMKKLSAPEDMEDKLQAALEARTESRKGKNYNLIIVMGLLIVLVSYNSPSLASFLGQSLSSDKLIDYKELSYGNIKEMLSEENIQVVDESLVFDSGMEFHLDGLLIDVNNIRVMANKKGRGEHTVTFRSGSKGFSSSGYGLESADARSEDWIYTLEKDLKDKSLILEVYSSEDQETKEMEVKIDEKKILRGLEKIKINKKIKTDTGSLYLEKMNITPTSISLSGHTESILELAINTIFKSSTPIDFLEIDLKINGEIIEESSSSLSRDLGGGRFSKEYHEFPSKINSLSIIIRSINKEKVDQVIELI